MSTNPDITGSKWKFWRKLSLPAWTKSSKTKRAVKFGTPILALVLIAAGGYLFYYLNYKPKDSLQDSQTAIRQAAMAVGTGQKKDYDSAITQLLEAKSKANTTEGKFQATYALAGWYADKGDHINALKYYQEAEPLMKDTNVNIFLGIANQAEATKDKELAKKYYQKAIDHYKAQTDASDSEKELLPVLQQRINDLS